MLETKSKIKSHWDLYIEAKFEEALANLELNKGIEFYTIDRLILEGANLKTTRNFEIAEKKCLKALELSEKIDYYQGIGYSSYELAYIHFLNNNSESVKKYADYSLRMFNFIKTEPCIEKLRSKTFIALYYQLKGNNKEAEMLFRSNIMMAKHIDSIHNLVANLINLNNILRSEGKFEEALIEYKIVLRSIISSKENYNHLSILYNNIADIEELLGFYDLAEKNYLKAEEYCLETDIRLKSTILRNLGNIFSKKANFDKAEYYFKEEIKLVNVLDEKWMIARSLKHQASNYKRKGDLLNAKALLEESISILKDLEIFNHHYHETICNYVEILGILGLKNEAYKHLNEANKVARMHESELERLKVLLESSRLTLADKNYHQAIFLLDDIVDKARKLNLFDLENNANILLVEAYLIEYIENKESIILDLAKKTIESLKNRTLESKKMPFYIRALYLESIILSYTESDKDAGLQILELALETAKKYGINNLEKHGKYISKELKRIPNIEESLINFAVINLRKFIYKPVITESFEREINDSRILFIAQAQEGPKVLDADDEVIKQDILFITKSAAYLSLAIGQGSDRHKGLFGPIPAPDRSDYLYFVYAFSIRDENIINIDKRYQDGQNYGMFALLVRNDVSLIFYDRIKLEEMFFNELEKIDDIKSIDKYFLKHLRTKLLDNALKAVV